MTAARPWVGLLAALGLALSGTLTGAIGTGGAVAGGAAAAYAGSVPDCTAGALDVAKGKLEGAAGSRYQTVRVTNGATGPARLRAGRATGSSTPRA